jgi:hypothetical protein
MDDRLENDIQSIPWLDATTVLPWKRPQEVVQGYHVVMHHCSLSLPSR